MKFICSFAVSAIILIVLCSSCAKHAFVPVNVGREHGDPVPLFVSHIPKLNQGVLARTPHHFFLRKILCFDYVCRRMIGRNKSLAAISFADFEKRVKKNAKKGAYKKYSPANKKVKRDTIAKPITTDTVSVRKDAEPVVTNEKVAAVDAPLLKTDSLITLTEILFETNSAKLKSDHFSSLDALASYLLAHPTLEVSVLGHTDNVGKERNNVLLSTRRAEVVAEYIKNKGVADERVAFEGFGSSRPVTGNETSEGRSKNRRVELLIHDRAGK